MGEEEGSLLVDVDNGDRGREVNAAVWYVATWGGT